MLEIQSFSYKVKEEIIQKINTKSKADACLLGMLMCANNLGGKAVNFLTENEEAADFFIKNCQRITLNEECLSTRRMERKNGCLFNIEILNEGDRLKLFDHFNIKLNARGECERRLLKEILPKEKYFPQLIGGIFLSCGCVNNPEKKYHMEFNMPDLNFCNDFGFLLIEKYSITPKYVERKNSHVVYIKESENIIDMLTLMGASMCSMEIMNVKMMKDMRNKINRAVNCDNANIEKSLKAAQRQWEDIELIDSVMGIDSLEDNLKQTALLRYENPDLTLKELGELLDPPISRSGINHRLMKIGEIAQKIREEKR